MFFIPISTNRQPSIAGFYFLYFLFLLHICTAFFTIINAFNSDLDDTEAIIQLSMDSIHVVKSSDPRITNIEENINDNEEKELVMALLTSYDDELKIDQQIDNEISIIDTSTSIRFIPDLLHFSEQSIAIPQMRKFLIINDDSESLELYSLFGATNQFYSSSFKQTILPPYGGNTSINIYYLPRTLGITKTIFTIKTNRGDFSYHVDGIGKSNPFRLRPLVNAIIPLNSTFEYTIQFYNPHNYSLDINEIYTSDENLIIELLSDNDRKNKITKVFEHHQQWRLKSFESKAIIKITYFAYKLNQLQAFICIKTNLSDIVIIPVEINVSNRPGLYSNVDLLEFSNQRFIRSVVTPITIPVYVFNYGLDPVMITNVRVTPKSRNYITVHYKNLQLPPDINRLNQIADITIDPHLIPNDIHHIHGYIQVYTSSSIHNPALEIPFDEIILHGTLDYKKEETHFHIASSNKKKVEQCRPIQFLSRYNTSISVYNITFEKIDLLSQYIKIQSFSSLLHLHPNQWTELLCITPLQQPLPSNIQSVVDIHTNLSFFNFVLHLYNGFLNLNLVTDHTNGGIRRNQTDPFELSITSIPVNTVRTVTFLLANPNPIDIKIEKFYFTLPNAKIQLDYMKLLDGNQTKILSRNKDISQLVIPEQHQAIFSLTIDGKGPSMFHNETITFQTQYQIIHINVHYEIINGSLEFVNKTPIHIDVFPHRVGTMDIFVQNKFNVPINVLRMDFITYGICFAFAWSNTSIGRVELESNKIQRVGRLTFDIIPLCKSILTPSESTCYCGLNHHSEFKQRWDEHFSALNTHEFDYTLVNKFRNLWKEWTALVRKERIQTNIWLYTDRANISWPVTIGFVWPSVLEHMSSLLSRTPITLDFQTICVNTTKTQNVIITNPSSDLLVSSVKLLNGFSDNSKSIINDRSFTISTTSKRVDLKNDIYNFNLLPNEHITFTVTYRPTLLSKHEMYFVVQNNLTTIESILLRGEGGIGNLQVGNRKAGSSLIPLILEIDEKQYKFCTNTDEHPILRKTVTLQNTGTMKTIIHDISFGHSKCSGQGFSASVCKNIEIDSNEKYDLKILFQPDYTSDEINETLILNTNIGMMTIPIIVRIPQRVLSACYQTIPRPPWEFRTYSLWLCTLLVFTVLIFVTAIYDSRRLFDNYLTRAEWRNNVQMTSNKIFDLSDLSSAVHDEQKTRERIESHPLSDTKKENIIETSKNEIKSKRSLTLSNTNEETPIKPTRTSDSSSTAVRSTAPSPKPTPTKLRRATTDSGSAKVSLKQQQETSVKVLPIRRQKSETSSRAVSTSALSDDENEPFVMARPRRLSSKTKESTIKSTTNNTSPVIQKSSPPHSNPSDQQRQTVNSNKGQRKGTTPRRETTDEPQTTQKIVKSSSINSENPVIPSASARRDSSVSDDSPQSHHHAERHSTYIPSLLSVSILTDKKSLQDDISLIKTNRNADDEEENIDWDEPAAPDDDFTQYGLPTEFDMDDTNERTQIQPKLITNTIPPLMSLTITPPPIMTTNIAQKSSIPSSVIKENIEPLPFPQHGPGPIQRPNKLLFPSTTQFLDDSTQSPNTPDVLDQINHLLDHQNSITTIPSTPNVSNSTTLINDMPTPNVPWTPFAPTEWSTKYDSSWPSSNVSLTTQIQNPFAQRQISKEEASVWLSSLGTTTSSNTCTQQVPEWNELFSSAVPSSNETTKPTNTSWLKFLPAPDPSSVDGITSNKPENETNNPFWNSINLNEWSKTPSDENNNDHDQSRWDFAR